MIKPQKLKSGDKIAVVSLSYGAAGEEIFSGRLNTGLRRLKEVFNLEPVIMPHALKGIDFIYRHPELRAKDLMEAFKDDSIKGILCTIGGDDTVRIMPYIDYNIIKNNPKVFMGYSDTTANHFMMYKAGLTSFHGPSLLVEFAENVYMHDYTVDYIKKTLFEVHEKINIAPSPLWTAEFLDWTVSENNIISRKMTKDLRGYELLQGKGIVRGKLLGGCLEVMQMIVGTEIWPSLEQWKDKILFLETSEETPSPQNILYFLRNLHAMGIFDVIRGITVGKPYQEKYYEDYKEIYKRVFEIEVKRPDLPILYNVNYGHNAPTAIIPYGIEAEINCERKSFTLMESGVTE